MEYFVRVTMTALMLILWSFGNVTLGEDWYRWRGPNLDGQSQESDWSDQWPDEGPKIAWTQQVGTGFASVTISDGLVFTSGNAENQDTVFCFDAETGEKIWDYSFESPLDDKFFEGGPTSTPTVAGPHLINLSRQGELVSFHKHSGEIHWKTNVAEAAGVRVSGWGFSGSPLVQDDRLLLNVGEAGTAVDRATGEVIWTSNDSDAGYASVVPFQWKSQEYAIVASGKFVIAVDANDGTEAWRYRWLTRFGANCADPIIEGDRIFISSGYNRGSALLRMQPDEPEVIWKHKEFQNQLNSSVLIDEHLYGIDGDIGGILTLKCMRFDDGEIMWQEEGFGSGSLIAADGRLIVLSEDGQIVIAESSPSKYREISRAKVLDGKCWTSPVLSNGKIYCRNSNGELVCVNVSDHKRN